MTQIQLNDPNRSGGSSQIDLSADSWALATYNALMLARNFADINEMFEDVYSRIGYLSPTLVGFSSSVQLNEQATLRTPATAVTGPLAFSPASGAVAGSACIVRLVANGTCRERLASAIP